MKKTLIKYGIYIIIILSIFYLSKLVIKQSKEIRDLKDLHTTEILQLDSLQQVHTLTKSQFKNIIYSKDSLLKSELDKKDIKIKNLNAIIKAGVNQTIVVKDTIIKKINIDTDTVIPIKKKIECLTLYGLTEIKNKELNLIIDSLNFNFNIIVTDYYDVIYWYNFKKRKESGYSLIGFRNHYINKTTATSDCFGDKVRINLYKIKK